MTLKERIEAAIDVMHEKHADAADIDGCVRDTLRAAFPELFDGSAWLAPMEATAEMRVAGWPHFSALGDKPNGALDFADRRYRAMRDAHLATSPSSTPSTSETERQRG